MNPRTADPETLARRRFLRGAGGAVLGLPWLDLMSRARTATGAPARPPVTAAIVVNANGVQQAGMGTEPERFWPHAFGPLSRQVLAVDNADRAVGELADHAERLILVRGIKTPFPIARCDHQQGGIQVLTAARFTDMPTDNKTLSLGESVDNAIARQLGATESLLLYAGSKHTYANDDLSFRGPRDLRIGEGNPYVAYTKLIGLGAGTSAAAAQKLAARRASVNDLVRGEMNELLARRDLGVDDRRRLEQHRAAIRDIEIKLGVELPAATVDAMRSVDGQHTLDANRLKVVDLQMALMVFALSSGRAPIAVLQSGDAFDGMTHTIDGVVTPRFHLISHRLASDATVGDGAKHPEAVQYHHQIDRIHARQFKGLLDRMAAEVGPEGSLLDTGFALWTNQLGTGSHNHHNLPFVFAGKARGFFRTGQALNVSNNPNGDAGGNLTVNRIHNVLIGAMGVRKPDGSLVDDFGDPSLAKGVIPQMLAAP